MKNVNKDLEVIRETLNFMFNDFLDLFDQKTTAKLVAVQDETEATTTPSTVSKNQDGST